MQITELLDGLDRDALIDLFGLPAVQGVESRLTDKSGKPYVHCLARGKPVQARSP